MKVDLQFNCPKLWNEMSGDDRIRHCSFCDKNVHNLSTMTEEDAAKLVRSGNSCVTMRVNQHGEIRTRSGFSKGLLLMGFALGCSGEVAPEKNTKTSINSEKPKIEDVSKQQNGASEEREIEVMGDVAPEDDLTSTTDPDCDSSKDASKQELLQDGEKVMGGAVVPHSINDSRPVTGKLVRPDVPVKSSEKEPVEKVPVSENKKEEARNN